MWAFLTNPKQLLMIGAVIVTAAFGILVINYVSEKTALELEVVRLEQTVADRELLIESLEFRLEQRIAADEIANQTEYDLRKTDDTIDEIEKDIGDLQDGEVAPVLRDTLNRLRSLR